MRLRSLTCHLLAVVLCCTLTGCQAKEQETKKQITLIIKTTPIGLGDIPDVGEVEVYDLFTAAAEKFAGQYDKYDIKFEISRYNYLDEKTQLEDKYGTEEAADIFYSGSYNTPTYAARGWLTPLDDIIDEELRQDIDEAVWEQCSIDGKVYTIPFQQMQNTLMVNRSMMEEAGLEKYIPEGDSIAHWSTEEFNTIVNTLKNSFEDDNRFAFMMYALNNQGDNHIMTLLQAYGGTLYDEDGNFKVNSPEGIQALEWITEMDEQGITPRGAENLELVDCMNLFYNGQLGICIGNLSNMWDSWNRGLDVFAVNFPSLDGNGYCTSSLNGFCVFDNKDEDKLQAAKDFVRFIYTDEELMTYTLATLPVNNSVIDKYQGDIRMLQEYGDNITNTVDNIRNNCGWQEVRDTFYLNIQNLLRRNRSPAEVAADIDESCNAALARGRANAE